MTSTASEITSFPSASRFPARFEMEVEANKAIAEISFSISRDPYSGYQELKAAGEVRNLARQLKCGKCGGERGNSSGNRSASCKLLIEKLFPESRRVDRPKRPGEDSQSSWTTRTVEGSIRPPWRNCQRSSQIDASHPGARRLPVAAARPNS